MVDGLGIGDVGNIVFCHEVNRPDMPWGTTPRKAPTRFWQDRILYPVVLFMLEKRKNLMDECHEVVNIALDRLYERGITDWGRN